MFKRSLGFFAVILFIFGFAVIYGSHTRTDTPKPSVSLTRMGSVAVSHAPQPTPSAVAMPRSVWLEVPFLPQAPFGDWDDPRQQDGCEEASMIMAMHWVRGTSVSRQQGLEEIHKLSEYEERTVGTYHDLSTTDLVQVMKDYYGHDDVIRYTNVGIADIKRELAAGRVVIIPSNGQKLGNPHFRGAGPEYHMLILKGYDDDKKQFIANDPGTRVGESYRYSYDTILETIRDYKTGYHTPITSIVKAMVSVGK